MAAFSSLVRAGDLKGASGKRVRNVVNIGIGGSDLGPVMAYEALRHYSDRDMTFRFVSNVDGTDFVEAVRDLAPDETLFVICSKTFTTSETLANARAARQWCLEALGDRAAVVSATGTGATAGAAALVMLTATAPGRSSISTYWRTRIGAPGHSTFSSSSYMGSYSAVSLVTRNW